MRLLLSQGINMAKKDPYAALRYKEFNIFLLVRFALIFGWSMQFVVIEWQVYAMTKDQFDQLYVSSQTSPDEMIANLQIQAVQL